MSAVALRHSRVRLFLHRSQKKIAADKYLERAKFGMRRGPENGCRAGIRFKLIADLKLVSKLILALHGKTLMIGHHGLMARECRITTPRNVELVPSIRLRR